MTSADVGDLAVALLVICGACWLMGAVLIRGADHLRRRKAAARKRRLGS